MEKNYLPSLAIITPCLNEEAIIESSVQTLLDALQKLSKKNLIDIKHSKLVVVDDGSSDNSWNILKKLHKVESKIHCIKLSRNFGHQNALLSGILNSSEDLVITVDIDLQDDIEVMEKMLQEYSNGYEIVYGVKKDRSADGFLKNFFATSFYTILSFLGADVIRNHADFRLLSQKVIKALREFKEINIYLRGIIPLLGFQSTSVEYALSPRQSGETKYVYKKSLSLALDGITSFSLTPLRLIGVLGFFIAFFSILITCYYLFESMFTNNTIPGWASTVLPIYFLGAVQLISLGVISEYIGKLFIESKKRPNFIIEELLK
jgi:glycosyltransferase involved in cell wall biosynthesis